MNTAYHEVDGDLAIIDLGTLNADAEIVIGHLISGNKTAGEDAAQHVGTFVDTSPAYAHALLHRAVAITAAYIIEEARPVQMYDILQAIKTLVLLHRTTAKEVSNE